MKYLDAMFADLVKSLNGVDFSESAPTGITEQVLMWEDMSECRVYLDNNKVYSCLKYQGEYLSQWHEILKEAK